jgi:hypothetical protein
MRTLPNPDVIRVQQYSVTNPPDIDKDAMRVLARAGIDHIVVD